jgi:hypothetical protein
VDSLPENRSKVTSDERYRCAELVWVRLDGERCVVYAKDTGVWRVLPNRRAEVLARCNVFDTLENHARARCREFGLGENAVEMVRSRLVELAEAGFLIGFGELQERCRPSVRPTEEQAKITSVGFLTRDRLPLLERGLTSFIENAQRHGRPPSFVVMDDTENADAVQQCCATLRALAARYGVMIRYGDLDDRKTFATALVKETGVPPEVVEFALFGSPSYPYRQANHNALLLDTAGELIFRADDDVLAQVAAPPDAQPGLRFFTEQDPAEYWFFDNREAALQAVSFVDKDVLGLHEQFLGKTMGDCFAAVAPGEELNLNQLTAVWARRCASGGGRVLLTMNGLVGDCAMTWPRWYWLSEPSRGRLVRSEAAYRAAFASREVVRSVRAAAIGPGPFCMTYAIGMDNRTLLPPLFPIGRGTDGMFAQMTQRCSQDGLLGHLPWAIVHAPGETRTVPPQVVRTDAAARDLSLVIDLCGCQCTLGMTERSAAERLTALGRHLGGLAALPLREFEEWLRLALWNHAQQELQATEGRLRTWGESPVYWAKDLRDYTRTLTEAMQHREYVVPRELQPGRTTEEALELMRQWVGRYGELLQAWPALVDAARRLRGNEQRLAKAV